MSASADRPTTPSNTGSLSVADGPTSGEAFALYVHVPYCTRKCPYCDFNVHVVRRIPEERYVDALLRELHAAARQEPWHGRRVGTIFFGGGTPSLFAAHSFERLVAAADEAFGLDEAAEISLEANPEDLIAATGEQLHALRTSGVNRLSLGAQSFDPEVLVTLGRQHGAQDVARAVERARAAGFRNVSCDLIFGVPGQSLAAWQRDLDRLLRIAPEHVSTYGLTYEEGTPLTSMRESGRLSALSEETERDMYETAIDTLQAAGFRHYEISNFARPGFESHHNLTYWSWGDYLGLGAGAHGFSRRDTGTADSWGFRYMNVKAPGEYMDRAPAGRATSETLDRTMAMAEFVLLGLRRTVGFSESSFEQTFAVALDEAAPALGILVTGGLLSRRDGRIALTREGLLLADSVTAKLAQSLRDPGGSRRAASDQPR